MPRRERGARRLLVGEATYLWSVGHSHQVVPGGFEGCTETVVLRRHGARGRLSVAFVEGPGRFVPDGYLMHSGLVAVGDATLNLHEPGTARALLDVALEGGWDPDDPPGRLLDGWELFDAVRARRPDPPAG